VLVFSDVFNPLYPPWKLHFYLSSKATLVAKRACIHPYTAYLIPHKPGLQISLWLNPSKTAAEKSEVDRL
jgi:hypothetical protein